MEIQCTLTTHHICRICVLWNAYVTFLPSWYWLVMTGFFLESFDYSVAFHLICWKREAREIDFKCSEGNTRWHLCFSRICFANIFYRCRCIVHQPVFFANVEIRPGGCLLLIKIPTYAAKKEAEPFWHIWQWIESYPCHIHIKHIILVISGC